MQATQGGRGGRAAQKKNTARLDEGGDGGRSLKNRSSIIGDTLKPIFYYRGHPPVPCNYLFHR